jgi:hypothetical protein
MTHPEAPPPTPVASARELVPPLRHQSGRALTFREITFENGTRSLEIGSVAPDGRVYAVRVPARAIGTLRAAIEAFAAEEGPHAAA